MSNRYVELRPDQIEASLAVNPVIIIPWGAIEWHGPHLPLGLDGLVAEAFCDRLADRTGALVLPTLWLPVTPLPHKLSLSITTNIVTAMWEDLLEEICRLRVEVVCSVSGHYAQPHEQLIMEVAERIMDRKPATHILTGTPLSLLGDPDLLDHAGRYETGQLLALRPDLVALAVLGDGPLTAVRDNPVLGSDPRLASAHEGETLLARGLDAWVDWTNRLRGPAPDLIGLRSLYEARRLDYRDFAERYFKSSWDDAIQTWWQEKSQ